MNEWHADLDVEPMPNGKFAPVIVLIPPVAIGQPLRQRIEGEYDSEEQARLAVLDAMVELTR